jgi:signal transduction histidine kinase
LTIAQRFVRECRGRILVESVLGKGSTFIVELPLVSIGG